MVYPSIHGPGGATIAHDEGSELNLYSFTSGLQHAVRARIRKARRSTRKIDKNTNKHNVRGAHNVHGLVQCIGYHTSHRVPLLQSTWHSTVPCTEVVTTRRMKEGSGVSQVCV